MANPSAEDLVWGGAWGEKGENRNSKFETRWGNRKARKAKLETCLRQAGLKIENRCNAA